MSVPLKKEQKVLLNRCQIATSFFSRFMGLMGKKEIAEDAALVFPHCNSIHTFFMRFPIDVIFVDAHGCVVSIVPAMRPWRVLMPQKGAKHAVEMAAGRFHELGIEIGTKLECEGAWR